MRESVYDAIVEVPCQLRVMDRLKFNLSFVRRDDIRVTEGSDDRLSGLLLAKLRCVDVNLRILRPLIR